MTFSMKWEKKMAGEKRELRNVNYRKKVNLGYRSKNVPKTGNAWIGPGKMFLYPCLKTTTLVCKISHGTQGHSVFRVHHSFRFQVYRNQSHPKKTCAFGTRMSWGADALNPLSLCHSLPTDSPRWTSAEGTHLRVSPSGELVRWIELHDVSMTTKQTVHLIQLKEFQPVQSWFYRYGNWSQRDGRGMFPPFHKLVAEPGLEVMVLYSGIKAFPDEWSTD